MITSRNALLACLLCLIVSANGYGQDFKITRAELVDKIHAFWVGQLVGNYVGFPFELIYVEEAIPVLVDRYYTPENAGDLRINRDDHRGHVPIMFTAFDGAYSDDDTDIEFVTLHAVEKYGLDITYPEIAEAWKTHINRRIWVANRTARNLMDEGLTPPETGSKEHNENWFQIDPQLVNEIWSAFYPGMPVQAAKRAEWAARITNDDWGTHPTIAYAVMISKAFFEPDPEKLVREALLHIPYNSPFNEGMRDVLAWYEEHPDDWRATRDKIHEKYYRYSQDGYEAPVSVISSLCNGLCGIMAILYGEGDFMKTVGIATSAGYDCDNQAATCGGLLGVMNGMDAIPTELTQECLPHGEWDQPFNDIYINYSRDHLPNYNRISDIVERIANVAEMAIIEQGGEKIEEDGEITYVIPCDC